MNRPIGLKENTKKVKQNHHKAPISIRIIQSTIKTLEQVAPKIATFIAFRLFSTPIRYKMPERENFAHQTAHKSTLKIGGLPVCIYRWGHPADPVVLFLHGWSGRGTQVAGYLGPLLEAGYQVLSVDAPAHGQSGGKTTNILEVAQVVDYLGRHYPIEAAIGHSFGGVALHYSIRNAILFSKLVTISSPMESDFILMDFIGKIGGTPSLAQRIRTFVRDKFSLDFDSVAPMFPQPWPAHPDWLIIHDEDDHDVPASQAGKAKEHPMGPEIVLTNGLGHYRILRDEHVIHTIIDWLRR